METGGQAHQQEIPTLGTEMNVSEKNCLLCHTKQRTDKHVAKDCHKIHLLYETRCLTCEQTKIQDIDIMEIYKQDKNVLKQKIANLNTYEYYYTEIKLSSTS